MIEFFFINLVIILLRFSKKYRHPALDAALTKDRHRAECRALLKVRFLFNY